MRSFLTRTAQHKKGHRLTPVAFAILAAAVFVIFGTAIGNAAYRGPLDNITTGSLPPPGTDKQVMRHALNGTEGLELAARLTADGGLIRRPVNWQVFERNTATNTIGNKVYSGETPVVDALIPPGDYTIKVKYGHAKATRNVTILPQTRIEVIFVLNVGGIRTMSRVAGIDASHYSKARHAIYALDDDKPANLVTKKISQGEIVRLAAGSYRIESRFDNGNTLAVAKVTVKPGILTSLNIDHQAALAKLSLQSVPGKPVNWKIHSLKGGWTRTGNTLRPTMILAPGRYIFSAKIGNTSYQRTVSLAEGKATIVVLGK